MIATSASPYDSTADSFEQHRDLPRGVPEAIRTAIWSEGGGAGEKRVLDLGAGTGRFGLAFVAAGDRYVGVDASIGMLQAFARQEVAAGLPVRGLAQATGEALPFADATFDLVMLMQVLTESRGWKRMLADTQRVLRAGGKLVVGRTVKPEDGVDARLKNQLAAILSNLGVESDGPRGQRTNALSWLEAAASACTYVEATAWTSERTPRRFLERHQTGHRFSQLPQATREGAMGILSAWAVDTFGSLDAVFPETYRFGLQVFTFSKG